MRFASLIYKISFAVNALRHFFVAARRLGTRSIFAFPVVSVGVYFSLTQAASARFITLPSGGSPNASDIASLYDFVLVLAVLVFLAVTGFVLYSVWAFRAHKNPVALQIHGNTKLELSLTASAALIVVVIAVVTFVKLPGIVNPPSSNASSDAILSASLTSPTPPTGHELTVCVTGRQFIWRYTYGANCNKSSWADRLPYSYQEMEVPSGEVVRLVIQSSDVIHDWWVPALGGKVDAVPGFTTYTWFKALHSNELYHGQCAQLCGRGHADMTALVKVVTPQQYNAWVTEQETLIKAQGSQLAELRQQLIKQGVLTSNGI